jgi:hypothetical protein
MWVAGLVQTFARGFVDIDIRNTASLEQILYFARRCQLELQKIKPNKTT